MGLDIYVGTLTRYYTHNWKTATQQWTEGNGYGFSRITAERDFFKKKRNYLRLQFRRIWKIGEIRF